MCHVEFKDSPGKTPAQKRLELIVAITAGQRKVDGHIERLRTEAPRIHAALLPLLEDLGEWMRSVGEHLSSEERRLSGVA